jgi:hypothetical protein
MRALIGLDIGTTAVKALAVNEDDGAIVARCEVGYPLSTPRPGWAEQDPEDWWRATEKALAELGVDVIEAGFPIASRGDWEAVNLIAKEVQGPIIAGLARCNREDIERAWAALKDAPRPRVHVFLATSAIHRQYKLNMAKDEIIRTAVEGVKIARSLCDDVEFSPEDASRTELEFLAQVVEAVVEAHGRRIVARAIAGSGRDPDSLRARSARRPRSFGRASGGCAAATARAP